MEKASKQPNILIVCSDQHSVHVSGSYGNKIISTPNLDRLSREGTQFDAAYCNCPLCVPSRMSFLSGLYPFKCDVLNNGCILDSRIPTFPYLLGGAGYHTVLSGRMHFVGPDQLHGFVERLVGDVRPYAFYGLERPFPTSPLPGELAHMEKPDPLQTVGGGSTSLLDYDKAVTEATCQWLNTYSESENNPPFLMAVGFFNPHCPYIASPDLYEKYLSQISVDPLTDDECEQLHPFHQDYLQKINIRGIPKENLNKAAAAYYGLVEFLDQSIGQILNTLEQTKLAKDTVIIYISDHGEMLGEHGRWHKGCFYEASSRVPFIIKIPGQQGGKIVSTPVFLVDLLPTLADLGRAEIPAPVDGSSLLPLIFDPSAQIEKPVLVEYYDARNINRMARLGQWKLNYYGRYDSYELFDLNADPKESNNIYSYMKNSSVVKDLKGMLFGDGWNKNIAVDFDKRMNQMGYWKSRINFARGMSHDRLLKNIPGYWAPIENAKNFLSET
jgi:choline-sulfatase